MVAEELLCGAKDRQKRRAALAKTPVGIGGATSISSVSESAGDSRRMIRPPGSAKKRDTWNEFKQLISQFKNNEISPAKTPSVLPARVDGPSQVLSDSKSSIRVTGLVAETKSSSLLNAEGYSASSYEPLYEKARRAQGALMSPPACSTTSGPSGPSGRKARVTALGLGVEDNKRPPAKRPGWNIADRCKMWTQARDKKVQQLQDAKKGKEMEQCTFRPARVTEKSRLAQPYEEAVNNKNVVLYNYSRIVSMKGNSSNAEESGEQNDRGGIVSARRLDFEAPPYTVGDLQLKEEDI